MRFHHILVITSADSITPLNACGGRHDELELTGSSAAPSSGEKKYRIDFRTVLQYFMLSVTAGVTKPLLKPPFK